MSDPTVVRPRSNHLPLIISLCVNLLLAGVIAIPLVRFAMYGPMFGRPMMHDVMGPGSERNQVHQMLSPRALMYAAPEKTDSIKTVLRAHHDRIAQLRTDATAARRKVIEAFSAQQFDKAAFEKSLAGMQAADAAFESEILRTVSETVALLSSDERRKAMEFRPRPPMFGDHGRRWGHGDRDRGDGPPPPPGGEQGPGGQPPRD
jgi:uncharacterized membrane protein